jgi:hypothetical protein
METVSIRDLRGAKLRESADSGKLLAITNHRVLIGIVIPVARAWIEHIIEQNWSHVRQGIDAGEKQAASAAPMATLDNLADEEGAADNAGGRFKGLLAQRAASLIATVVTGAVEQAPASKRTVGRLQGVLNPARAAKSDETGPGRDAEPDEEAVRMVRIGDLSAKLIERAGEAGQTLAITHDRELIGMIVPVTQGLVQFLIEQNISRVLESIALGEKELSATGTLTTPNPDPGRGTG